MLNTVSQRKAPGVIMCRSCTNRIVPKLSQPHWRSDVLRKAAAGMVKPEDPRAERIRKRKESRAIRTAIATKDMGLVKLILQGWKAPIETADDGECLECLRLQASAA